MLFILFILLFVVKEWNRSFAKTTQRAAAADSQAPNAIMTSNLHRSIQN